MFDFNDIERAISLTQKVIQVIGMAEVVRERVKRARKVSPKRR